MPNTDGGGGGRAEGGGGRHLRSKNVYWTEIKAIVPKEFVHYCRYKYFYG